MTYPFNEEKNVGWSDKYHESHQVENGVPILWLRTSSPVKLGRIPSGKLT